MHCRTLHPIFRKIAEKYRENKDIVFARMDLSSFKPVDLKVILPTYVFAYLIYYHVTHPKWYRFLILLKYCAAHFEFPKLQLNNLSVFARRQEIVTMLQTLFFSVLTSSCSCLLFKKPLSSPFQVLSNLLSIAFPKFYEVYF